MSMDGLSSDKVVREMPEWTKETKSIKCETCNLTLNAQGQAHQHFSGKSHAKKLKLLEASKQAKLNAPVKQEEFQSSNGNGAQVGGAEDVSRKRSLQLSIPCNVCKTTMNTEEQASAHFAGSKHAKKAKMEGVVPTSLTGAKEILTPEAAEASVGLGGLGNLTCTVCKITFNAQSQADQHYAGSKHAKKVKMAGMLGMFPENNQSTPAPSSMTNVNQPPIQLPIGQFHCYDCNITLNAQGQYDQHVTGANHIKKANKPMVEEEGERAGGLYCDACNITVKTPLHLQTHMEGNTHKENQKKMEVTMNYTHENL